MATSAAAQADRTDAAAAPHALPAWIYNHPDMTRLELERILRPSWQIACHVSQIARPGDFTTLDLGQDSIVVLRDREGRIRGFHNVCRHRGARLLDDSGHCPGVIVCPYHGWSYNYAGVLVGVPGKEGFPGLDKAQHGLKPVHVEVVLGFVFVCLAANPPPPLKERFAPFIAELEPYRMEEMVPLVPVSYEQWDVDWKVAMDNYLESYHVPVGHPGLNRMFTPDYEDQKGAPGIARGTSWLREQPSSRWSERFYQKLVVPTVTHLPEANRRCWRFYSVLPNLGIDVYPELMDFFQVLPRGPGKCVIRYAIFGLQDERREMRVLRALSNRINTSVNNEDRWLCERVQRGLASPSYTPGPLSALERWMLEFHNLLREAIPEVRLPAAPARFA
ncbi:MAG TPA: aromatic ring-hydroxylating dioxygenase subunit alpha [Steroidobacteraceae bacterium]|nr:aromatic ring-hydroxylating dioxygenase subunit alpha [Steroidobacteraceae bacterium]